MLTSLTAALAVGALQAPQADLTYAKVGETELQLDFFPGSGPGRSPLIIWIHGGGWSGGTRKQAIPARRLRSLHPEYAVASISYRLTGQAMFPAQIEDCRQAVAWLRTSADKLNIDKNRFAVWGSSAGGHLAALVGTINEWQGEGSNTKGKARVQAVVDYYGPTDLMALAKEKGFDGHSRPGSPESKLLGGPILERANEAAKANPIRYVSKDDPPFFIVHGKADPVVVPSQSQLLADALRSKGVQAELTFIDGAAHGGPAFLETALLERVHGFLQRAFGDKKP